jgi:hypothetical protein
MPDRYTKVILTVIALELFWLGIRDVGTPVTAQSAAAPTPVIIRGVEIKNGSRFIDALPIYEREPLAIVSARPLAVQADRPIPITSTAPMKIEADRPLIVETASNRPLLVQSIQAIPAPRPGE